MQDDGTGPGFPVGATPPPLLPAQQQVAGGVPGQAATVPVMQYATPGPYVPPAESGPYAQPSGMLTPAWREGSVLIVPAHAFLPGRCVKCNAAIEHGQRGAKRLKQQLAWHHPALYLLVPLGLLVYAVVALVVQKKATVDMSLCPLHNAKRKNWLAFTWVVVLLGLGMLVGGCAGGVGFAHHSDMWPAWVMLGGIVVAIVGAIVGLHGSRVLLPKRITDHHAWLTGAAPEFLDNFQAIQTQ